MTIDQAAEILKLTARRVRVLIASGRLPATKHGRDWWIEPADLAKFAKLPRNPGRPPMKKGKE